MARQLITDAPDDDAPENELPQLTGQQMNFVEGILAGKTASDAYRAAYTAENSTPRTIWAEASRVNTHPGVSAWIAAGRKARLGSASVTLDDHVRELERIREIALANGNIGAAAQCEHYRGKAKGHYTENIRDVTEHDPLQTLRAIAELVGDEAAERLAKTHNIPFTPSLPEHKTVN